LLYIKTLTLEHFKSFKKAKIEFKKGFNIIIGPNGSGKSNICDAILFSLGESSLKRLRVDKFKTLFNNNESKFLRVRLDLDGDEKLYIIREARSDGRARFIVNNKKMKKEEVIEILEKHRIFVNEVTTIAQGEINKLIEMNAKERRELIDTTSGIKEFESKKEEALKELDEVETRIRETKLVLNEKEAYLKELEKEKDLANQFVELNKRAKLLNYSILANRLDSIRIELNKVNEELSKIENEKNALNNDILDQTNKANELINERSSIEEKINKGSMSNAEFTRKLSEIESNINYINSRLNDISKDIVEKRTNLDNENKKINELKNKINENENRKSVIKKRLEELNLVISSSENQSTNIVEIIANLNKELASLNTEIIDIEEKERIAIEHIEKRKIEEEKLMELSKKKDDIEKELIEKKNRLSNLIKEEYNLNKEKAQLSNELNEINKKLIDIGEYTYNSRNELFEQLKNSYNGFYGRVIDLMEYDQSLSYAIYAALGQRIQYLVVDNIDTASKIIDYLKKNNLGRYTFIPLKNIAYSESKDSNGLLLNHITYDPRFDPVFKFLLYNTYLVNNIDEAKRQGIGNKRFVTIEGDLIEASGLITGGSFKKNIDPLIAEKAYESVKEEKKKKEEELANIDKKIFETRKEYALLQGEIASLEKTLEEIRNEMQKKIETSNINIDEIKKRKEELIAKRDEISKKINELIESNIGKGKIDIEENKKEREMISIELAKIEKEEEILKLQISDIEKEIKELNKTIANDEEESNKLSIEKEKLEKSKENILREMESFNKENKELYDKISLINNNLAEVQIKIEKNKEKISSLERIENEYNIKKTQLEVRISDIEAEIKAYNIDEPYIKEDPSILENELKEVNEKINNLGGVNLKAPEVYEERKKEVDSMKEKVEKLESEKNEVLRLIEEIDKRKVETFMKTFNEVNKNFEKLYSYIFPGKASIALTNPRDPFNSGLEILIKDSNLNLSVKSGGEKALLLLMLLFSIHLCRPSSIYIFDEIDSALDKENSIKLSLLIKELSKNAQFIVVSHNDSTIYNADAILGVYKSEDGSKVVGIDANRLINEKNEKDKNEAQ